MREPGTPNNNASITAASVAFLDSNSPLDPTWDLAGNPLALNLANPDPGSAIVDTDLSGHNVPTADASPAQVGPLNDADSTVTSLLASLDDNASGASDHGPASYNDATSDAADIDATTLNSVAQSVHTSSGNTSNSADAILIATNAASNQNGSLNSHFSDFGSGQPGYANLITDTAPHAPIPVSIPSNNTSNDGDATGTTAVLFGGESKTGTTTQTTTTSGGGSTTSGGSSGSGLIINVTYDASCANAPAAFKTDVAAAVAYFESHFSDPVTINISVGYGEVGGQTMGAGALGQSLYYLDSFNYSTVKNALVTDATTANDTTAIGTLPSTDPTNGGTFWVTTAEAKAIGLDSGSFTDGYVGFSGAANIFDFNTSDGVTAGQYDFMGTVMHEISEVLGRETMNGQTFSGTRAYSPLDLFHYSASGVRDFAGTTPGYFSINAGQTNLSNFNTNSGGDFGDWAGNTIDAANAYGTPGVVSPFSTADLTVMDVTGWNLSATGPAAPTITSFSPDTGVVGDRITDANVLTLSGTAAASSIVNVYDGSTLLGTATANSGGAWSFTTAALGDGSHSFTATDTVSGATSSASAALTVAVDTVAPGAPVISNDTVLNTNQVALNGTALDHGIAVVGEVVKIYDGSTLVGTTTTNSTGAWSFTTTPLGTGTHNFTAAVTDVAGNTSVASTPLSVIINTPVASTIASFSPDSGTLGDGITDANVLALTGTAAASSTVNVYDGATLLGTAIASASGAWSFTTATLADGSHNFTATDTVSGATSSASTALAVTVDSIAPGAPIITSDTVINGTQVAVNGTALDNGIAEAGAVIKIYDGSTLIGTTTTNSTGAWSYTSAPLSDGYHVLTATVTDLAGNTSAASQAFDPAIAPPAPVISTLSPDSGVVGDHITNTTMLALSGTAEANTSVSIYDGAMLLGTSTVNSSGAWSFSTATLSNGTHSFTATDTDALSLTSVQSSAFNVTVDTAAPTDAFTGDVKNSNGSFTLTGTALDNGASAAGDVIKIYDGTTYLGSTTVGGNGQFNFTTAALSNTVHSFTSTPTDAAGNLGQGSVTAIYGSTGNNTLVSTAGNDIMTGSGGADTFVFNGSSFGGDVVTDFVAQGGHHDVMQFSANVFNNFAAVLAHAAQVGSNVVISVDATDSVTLNNVQLTKLASADFHFV